MNENKRAPARPVKMKRKLRLVPVSIMGTSILVDVVLVVGQGQSPSLIGLLIRGVA